MTDKSMRTTAFAAIALVALAGCTAAGISAPSAAVPSTVSASPTVSSETSPSGPPTSSAAAGSSGVVIMEFAFKPGAITVTRGSKIAWTNSDSTAHTVTLDDNSVDSGALNVGSSFDHTFATAGTFPYHCTIHSFMHRTIKVT
jgi:plastocyanin